MNPRLLGLIPRHQNQQVLGLYAYASNGLPGLEILGLPNAQGKCLKEKVIYLGREQGLALPPKRYMISVEGCESLPRQERDGLKYLELPIIFLFWSMTGHLNLRRPQDCLISGHVGLDGKIHPPPVKSGFWKNLNQLMCARKRHLTVIGPHFPRIQANFLHYFQVRELREVLGMGRSGH